MSELSLSSLSVLNDARGFVECFIAIASALGFYDNSQEFQAKLILENIRNVRVTLEELKETLSQRISDLQKDISIVITEQVQNSLREPEKLTKEMIDMLIKQLILLKRCSPNIIFAIILRYPRTNGTATQAFAAKSCEKFQDIIGRIDTFLKSVEVLKGKELELTAYVWVQIRGRYDAQLENFASAVTATIATKVCGLSSSISLQNSRKNNMDPDGAKTKVLLKARDTGQMKHDDYEVDERKRVFIIGESRSGKSTVGNAIYLFDRRDDSSQGSLSSVQSEPTNRLRGGPFAEARGMTGTLTVSQANITEEVDNEDGESKMITMELFDTPGFNDKDGLDILYETNIEDKIALKEKVSTFIFTMSAGDGLKGSDKDALEKYTKMFGENVLSMLIIVLTTGDPLSEEELFELKEDNYPTLSTYHRHIDENNIYAVSLSDLRDKIDTPSHKVIAQIKEKMLKMPLVMTELLMQQLKDLLQGVDTNNRRIKSALESLKLREWGKYYALEKQYEKSRILRLTDNLDRIVFQAPSAIKQVSQGRSSRSLWKNILSRTIVQVEAWDDRSKTAWREFPAINSSQSPTNVMGALGNYLHSEELAVFVEKQEHSNLKRYFSTLYKVSIFDPNQKRHHKLRETINRILDGRKEQLVPDLVRELPNLRVIDPSPAPTTIQRRSTADWQKFYLKLKNNRTLRNPYEDDAFESLLNEEIDRLEIDD